MIQKKMRLYRQTKKTGNLSNYCFTYKECKHLFRKAEWTYVSDIIKKDLVNNNSKSKPFWHYIRSKQQDNIGIALRKSKSRLFNEGKQKPVDTGCLLKEWTNASVAPLFKKGDKHITKDYHPHPVTLTNDIRHL